MSMPENVCLAQYVKIFILLSQLQNIKNHEGFPNAFIHSFMHFAGVSEE